MQKRGCTALWGIIADNADNQVKAGAAGAVEAVVAAMRAHEDNAEVQEHGQVLLDHLDDRLR